MRKYIGICSLALFAMLVIASVNPVNCFAWGHIYQQELTDNPKLDEANNIYKKAIRWIEEGDISHQPQRAAQYYDTAESYLRQTVFALNGIGIKQAIDVTKEIEFCEKLERETHSKQGDAKRSSR